MQTITLTAADGKQIHCVAWDDLGGRTARGVVQIAHGMGEHIGRYGHVAAALNAAGWLVVGNDHRGHGQTDPERLGDMGDGGWDAVVEDAVALSAEAGRRHPGLPLVLLGHSMGAMLAQQYVCRAGDRLAALVLSGTPGSWAPEMQDEVAATADEELQRLGPGAVSEKLQEALFGGFNTAFDGSDATGFEWLSRDPAAVQAYIDDPYCGSVLAADALGGLMRAARAAMQDDALARIPPTLPVFILCGADDPVHGNQEHLERLLAAWRGVGLQVEVQLYPGGRHELFNETNREEVLADLVAWLDRAVPTG